MTGSYDGTLKIFDERNMKIEVDELNSGGKSIWDVKFNQNKEAPLTMGIASIYDGYLFAHKSTIH